MKTLAELAEREMLALAISSEEEDSRIYMTFAEDLTERYPASAKMFVERAAEDYGPCQYEFCAQKHKSCTPVAEKSNGFQPPGFTNR